MIPITSFRSIVKTINLAILLSIIFVLSSTSHASENTRYISDTLIINLRSSLEKPFKVVGRLKSNDELELLELKGRYARVKTINNEEGWIATQYLTKEIPKDQKIKNLEEKLKLLNGAEVGEISSSPEATEEFQKLIRENDKLQREISLLAVKNEELRGTVSRLKTGTELNSTSMTEPTFDSEKTTLISKLKAENDFLSKQNEEITVKNMKLDATLKSKGDSVENYIDKSQLQLLQSRNQTLKKTVSKLENERMIYWFSAGAVVFFLGMLTSKLFGRKSRKFGY